MVLSLALPKRGGFLDEILQKTVVAHALRSAVTLDLIRMHGEDFGQREVVGH